MKNKIISADEIGNVSEDLRQKGKKIVTCNGAFDIIHAGHIKFLREAKGQGDVLIVGLNSDTSVKKNKGSSRPINNQKDRAEVLSNLEMVDYVVIFDEEDPRNLLEKIRPNVHVNGEEYGTDCIEAEVVKKNGGKIHIVKKIKGLSTTNMIDTLSSK